MAALWDAAAPMTAKAIGEELGDRTLALTTVLTVLSRLEGKGMVRRDRDERPHTYVAVSTRDEHVAELMREALGTAADRDGALVRFVGSASEAEVDALRRALRSRRRG